VVSGASLLPHGAGYIAELRLQFLGDDHRVLALGPFARGRGVNLLERLELFRILNPSLAVEPGQLRVTLAVLVAQACVDPSSASARRTSSKRSRPRLDARRGNVVEAHRTSRCSFSAVAPRTRCKILTRDFSAHQQSSVRSQICEYMSLKPTTRVRFATALSRSTTLKAPSAALAHSDHGGFL